MISSSEHLYGVLIEFRHSQPLIEAAQVVYRAGYRKLDAYTPYPVEELAEAIGAKKDFSALLALLGGLWGGSLAFLMQWYCNVMDYPLNVGGRPDFSWPAFIPVTFELTVLCSALSAALGMLALNRLPEPWHPVFQVPEFLRASQDRFFLCIEATDPLFDSKKIHSLLLNIPDLLAFHEVKVEE